MSGEPAPRRRGPRRAVRQATGGEPSPESAAGAPGPVAAGDATRDDTDAGWGELVDDAAHERWLAAQRPPHWG